MDAKWRRCVRIREQKVGEERMLFDDETDSVHVLNDSAAFIWDCLSVPVDAAELEGALSREYEVDAEDDLGRIVGEALADLQEKGLIEPVA